MRIQSEFVLYPCVALGVLAIWIALRRLAELSGFINLVGKLPTTAIVDPRPSSDVRPLHQALNGYCNAFRQSAERNHLSTFNVEQRLASVRGTLAGGGAIPRAVVGLLILGSLLVTLINLQQSVAQLGNAFRDIAAKQDTGGVENIRRAMASIADSAGSAFGSSSFIIFLAVILLILNMLAHRRAAQSALRCVQWAHEAYDEALARATAADPSTSIQELGKLIHQMHEIAATFQETNNSLGALAQFGTRLESSTDAISEAISRLPASVGTAVSGLGGEVARHLSEDLRHQVEYLMKLTAIYGDQELRIKEIRGFMEESVGATKDASKALKALPGELGGIRQSITDHSNAAKVLNGALGKLNHKIEALPLMDLKAASSELRTAVEGLADSGKEISSSAEKLNEFLGGWRSVIHGEMAQISKEVAVSLRTASEGLSDALSGSQRGLEGALKQFQQATDELAGALRDARERAGKPNGVSDKRMEQLSNEIDELSKSLSAVQASRVGRILGFGKGAGA